MRDGGLGFDLSRLNPNDVVDLDVQWPADELIATTIIDTPGTSSLARDVSARTHRLLVPEDGMPRVDAVVFLLRTLNAADIALLKQIGDLVGGAAGRWASSAWRRGPTRSAPGGSTPCSRPKTSPRDSPAS